MPQIRRAGPLVRLRLQNIVGPIAIDHNHGSADGIPPKVVNKPARQGPMLFFEVLEKLSVVTRSSLLNCSGGL